MKFKVRSLREIVQKGVVAQSELDSVLASQDFLWKVRNTLHFLTGSHQDQLIFEHQERVAATLGYHDAESAARSRNSCATTICMRRGSAASRSSSPSAVSRPTALSPHRAHLQPPHPPRRAHPGRRARHRRPDDPRGPADAVGIFGDAQRHGVKISSRGRELLQGRRSERGARDAPSVVRSFLEVLQGRSRSTRRCGHARVGVLGAIFPEFNRTAAWCYATLPHLHRRRALAARHRGARAARRGEHRASARC